MTDPYSDRTGAQRRSQWIVDHAEYWTTVRFKDRKYERTEHRTLALAEEHARRMIAETPIRPVMIYAVATNGSSTWVKNVGHAD